MLLFHNFPSRSNPRSLGEWGGGLRRFGWFQTALVETQKKKGKKAQTTSHTLINTASHSLYPSLNSTRGQTRTRAPASFISFISPPAILGGKRTKKLGVAGTNWEEQGGVGVGKGEKKREKKRGAAVVKEGGMTWGQQMVREEGRGWRRRGN